MNNHAITWMIRHGIAPHLLMLALIVGGLVMSVVIRKEYMPETTLDRVIVFVKYPGAAPDELETAVVLPVEAVLSGLEGIRTVNTKIMTGRVVINAELNAGANAQKMYQDVQQAVGRITTFPQGMERPWINLASRVADVMEIVVHADLDRMGIKSLTEQLRDRLVQSPAISQIQLRGFPQEEVHIEIAQSVLQRYNLTLDRVAQVIKKNAVERSAGSIKARNGDILVSVDERRFWAEEFSRVPVLSDKSGDQLLLGDIASVTDGFSDERALITFDGQPSASLRIFRVGDQTPDSIASAVQGMWGELEAMLPPGAGMTVVDDDAKNYTKRLGLLLKNAFFGLLLVLVLMSLFLEYRLAFWVVAGIPSVFLGAILFLPLLDVSINMVSMFGFIIALGIVVDDAIIAGENIYSHMQEGMPFSEAASLGAKEVAVPLTFAILTNIVAFLPLLLLPGFMQLLFGAIPIVVVLCFLISWVEALFILPSHLATLNKKNTSQIGQKIGLLQGAVDRGLQGFIKHWYRPLLDRSLAWPSLILAIAISIFILVMAHALSGRMGFSLMPKMEGRWVQASLELPEDMSLNQVLSIRDQVEASVREMERQHQLSDVIVSVRSEIFETNLKVALLLVPSEEREVSTDTIKKWWREKTNQLGLLGNMRFGSARRGSSEMRDASLTVELRHQNTETLNAATKQLEDYLRGLSGVVGVVNSMTDGKPQWKLKLNDNGRSLGLDTSGLSQQMRAALYGSRALRQHRDRNQVTALVRLPLEERQAATDIENLLIHTGEGGYAPLGEVAEIERLQAPARITRVKGQRLETVGAEIFPEEVIPAVADSVKTHLIPELEGRFPGLLVVFGGDQERIRESVSKLQLGTLFALAAIYCLLAIAFHSYSQPLLIMAIIPFGAVGAVLGHMLLGYGLSVVSLMGMLALAGIVVNDSLILVEYANKCRRQGATPLEAIQRACERRFRPILLTTLTTFGGLAPMVFETSRQAQFVVPMAVSLGFGILFTTLVCLLVLPALYLLLETVTGDIKDVSCAKIQ